MRKAFYISISSLLIMIILSFFVFKADKDLNGIWIGEYVIDNELYSAEEGIMTFKDNKCFEKWPNHYLNETRESDNIFFNKINFDFENGYGHYEIINIDKDSLVIDKNPNTENSSLHIYRRLTENLKHKKKTEFLGKKFMIKSRTFNGTIDFKNDSTLIIKANNETYNRNWTRIDFEGYDILFISEHIPYLITDENEKNVNLKTLHSIDIEYTMTEFE